MLESRPSTPQAGLPVTPLPNEDTNNIKHNIQTFATINPFAPNQHFAIFNIGTAHWSLPSSWVSDMQSLFPKYAIGTASQPVSDSRTVPQHDHTKNPNFFKRLPYSSPPPHRQQYQISQTVTSPLILIKLCNLRRAR